MINDANLSVHVASGTVSAEEALERASGSGDVALVTDLRL